MKGGLTISTIIRRMRTLHGDLQIDVAGHEPGVTVLEFTDRIVSLSAALHGLGASPGDRLGTLMGADISHLALCYAVAQLGAVLHPLNVRFSDRQLEDVVSRGRDRFLIVDDEHLDRITALDSPGVERVVSLSELVCPSSSEISGTGTTSPISTDTPALLLNTSGTTGAPKGVMFTHGNIITNVLAFSGPGGLELRNDDVIFPVVPLYHALGWGLPFAAGLIGSSLVLPGQATSGEEVVRTIRDRGVTVAAGVPTIWNRVQRYLEETGDQLGRLRMLVTGGSSLSRRLRDYFEEVHDVRVAQTWGMTETGPFATVCRPKRTEAGWEERQLTQGRPIPGIELRVSATDEEGFRDVPGAGMIEVRGPWVPDSYDAAADDSYHDGWLRTGDLGRVRPDGYLEVLDRAKDVIKSGGEWISSALLERTILEHPDIRECAVVATSDEEWVERPKAFLVTDKSVSHDDLSTFLHGRVPHWWHPDAVEVVSELPRTSVGKVDKIRLRAQGTNVRKERSPHQER